MTNCLLQDEINQQEEKLMNEWLHRWGGSNSEAAFDLKFQFFCIPQIDGFIAYSVKSNSAIVIGDPVCSSNQQSNLALEFQHYCAEKKLNCIYVLASEQFAKWAIENICKVMLEIGEELVFNPMKNAIEGPESKRLRNTIHHAKNIGLRVHEYVSADTQIEEAIQKVGSKWLKGRQGPQIHLGNLNFFSDRMGKRWFYVQQSHDIIGMAMLSRLEARNGWLLKFLIVVPEAPRGTSESLMIFILDNLREENCSYLTYGTIPRECLGETRGLSKLSCWSLKIIFNGMQWFFKLKNRKQYWHKFHPNSYPTFLLFKGPGVSLKEIFSLLKTMKTNL